MTSIRNYPSLSTLERLTPETPQTRPASDSLTERTVAAAKASLKRLCEIFALLTFFSLVGTFIVVIWIPSTTFLALTCLAASFTSFASANSRLKHLENTEKTLADTQSFRLALQNLSRSLENQDLSSTIALIREFTQTHQARKDWIIAVFEGNITFLEETLQQAENEANENLRQQLDHFLVELRTRICNRVIQLDGEIQQIRTFLNSV